MKASRHLGKRASHGRHVTYKIDIVLNGLADQDCSSYSSPIAFSNDEAFGQNYKFSLLKSLLHLGIVLVIILLKCETVNGKFIIANSL
ncbi:hypothetical protein CSV74_13865 [Sporosarcina sp. P19]|nr:hypothetical protein CSV74_13865 [Sporosarcina sp. P19]